MSKTVVFGANGYIGQHLTAKLSAMSNELYLFDIQAESLAQVGKYKQVNITKPIEAEVIDILAAADFVFLFSGITGTIKSVENYTQFIDINEVGLLNILNCIKGFDKKPKIIFPSTRLIYKGMPGKLLKEDDEKDFKTIYAVNKFACEQYLGIFKNLYNIDFTIFRICVPYGNLLNRELSFGTLSHFINKAKAGQNITLFGDGQLKRTFTHIDDLTDLIIQGGVSNLTNNQVYNIGSDDHLSLLQVADAIAGLYNVKIEFTDFPPVDLSIESGDTMFDGSKLSGLMNYQYKHSFSNWVNSL